MSDNLKLSQGGDFTLTSAGLAEGTNSATFQIASTTVYTVDGRLYSKSATDNLTFTAGHSTQAVSTSCIYLIALNTSGTAVTVQGKAVLTADVTAGNVALEFPAKPAACAVIGYVRVDTNASTTFVPGTTDLGAAGITDTFVNLFAVPTAPLTA